MSLLTRLDNKIALACQKVISPKPAIISILIHCLFKNREQVSQSHADPQQSIDVDDFDQLIAYYKNRGYRFISADDLNRSLDPRHKYCFLTFDDGYFNNLYCLDILEKYQVPATFYISTYNVLEQKSFWWDVYYRQRIKEGAGIQTIRQEKVALKTKKINELEALFIQNYGNNAFTPIDDTDRPLTSEELSHLARHPLVCIGNHTHHHIIFDNYTIDEIIADIKLNQYHLTEITGKAPTSIAYPNGNIQPEVHPALRNMGIATGVTTIKGKNYFPYHPSSDAAYHLKRFTPWHGQLNKALPLTETDYHIKRLLRKMP